MRIGYLGPPGTFSHEVALAGRAEGDELVALQTNRDVVVAVQDGTVQRAVAPVENLIDGAVTAVLDALAFEAPDVSIVGEAVAAVHHVLAAQEPLALGDVCSVTSHHVALAQCGTFLRAELPGVPTHSATSTGEAIRAVAAGEYAPGSAAIGTASAARTYGAAILAEGIEDDADNRTRFAWLAPTSDAVAPTGGPLKTTLLFHGDGDGSAGWLVRCLSEFAFRGVNLTRIESRPMRRRLGHYLFHVDCDGAPADADVAAALAALRPHCEEVRILGTYAVANATIPSGHGG